MLSDWMESRGVSLAGGLGVFYEWSRSETEARGQVAAGPWTHSPQGSTSKRHCAVGAEGASARELGTHKNISSLGLTGL